MPLELNRYDVALAHDGLELEKALEAGDPDGYQVHRVVVLHADQLVAEQAAPRYGIAGLSEESTQKITWATLWCWCALKRMQVPVPEFPLFKGRLLSVDPVKPAPPDPDGDPDSDPDGEVLGLDPTGPPPDTGSP